MRLSTADAAFVYGETANGPMHGVSLTLIEGALSYQEVFDYYEPRVARIPRLRQKLAFAPLNLAHPRWVDDPEFDLRHHLTRYRLPPNSTLAQAEANALELAEPVLDRRRPLWRAIVLEGMKDMTLIATLTHHAFVDGATAVALSTVMTDASATPPPQEAAAPWDPQPEPDPIEQWIDAGHALLDLHADNLRKLMRPAQASATTWMPPALRSMAEPVMQAPWNRSQVGPKRQLAYFAADLQDIKRVRNALGGTVNDIAVTAVVEGLARYLEAKGEPTQHQYLRLMCPVNVRTEENDAINMTGNHVSGLFPRVDASVLGVGERLRRVRQQLKSLKQSRQAEAFNQLRTALPEAPPVAAWASQLVGTAFDPARLAAEWPAPVAGAIPTAPFPHAGPNFTLTNVPGPTWTQYVAGHRVLNQYGTIMLGGNLGMGVTANSYDGRLTIGFTVDPRLVPDVGQLRDFAEQAYLELLQLAGITISDSSTHAAATSNATDYDTAERMLEDQAA